MTVYIDKSGGGWSRYGGEWVNKDDHSEAMPESLDVSVSKLAIGDIVQTPEGPAVIVAGPDGAPAIKPLAVVKATKSKGGDSGREDRESSSPPKDGPGDDSTPPRPPAPTTPTPSGKATPISAGGGRVRGHEAA
jgi:hypothetical protein